MFENIAVLDAGTSSVKLMLVKTGFRSFEVVSMTYEDVDTDSDDKAGALADALGRILEENDIRGFTFLTNLPMEKSLIRNISFPFSDVQKIAEAIPFEAEETIPFRSDDMVMDFLSLKSTGEGSGRVMLAAAQRESVREFLEILHRKNMVPSRIGLESHALYECYKYFNKLVDENVIQLDLGHTKTLLNIISGNHLLYSRSIPSGTGDICRAISEILKISPEEARRLFLRLDLDLTSLENNYQKEVYRTLDLNKQKLKRIFDAALQCVEEISAQIALSVKSFEVDNGELEINRVLISGGGSNIQGIGMVFSRDFDLPVISLPFLENYSERQIQTQFPVVFGTMLSYMGGSGGFNFLRGEFVPDMVRQTRKVYYLSAFFTVLSAAVLLVYLAGSSIMKFQNSARYKKVLNERLKQYFMVRDPVKDPVGTASKLVNEEKKELANLDNVLKTGEGVLETMKSLLHHFPEDEGFQLKNMVINENVIRIDGMVSTSARIDEFKNKLIESKQFESVDLNTTLNKRNEVNFSMVVKKKPSVQRSRSGR